MCIENTQPYYNAIYILSLVFILFQNLLDFFFLLICARDPIFTMMECFVYIAEIHLLRLLLFSLGSGA